MIIRLPVGRQSFDTHTNTKRTGNREKEREGEREREEGRERKRERERERETHIDTHEERSLVPIVVKKKNSSRTAVVRNTRT